MNKAIKNVIGIVLVITMLMSTVILASAQQVSPLQNYNTNESSIKQFTYRDVEYKFIPDGSGNYYIQNVGNGLYLGDKGNLNLLDTPTSWKPADSNGNINLVIVGGRPLRRGDNGNRWALSDNHSDEQRRILLFKKTEVNGEVRYVEAQTLEDNAIYLIVNKWDSTSIPVGVLTNTFGDGNRASTGGDPRMDAGQVYIYSDPAGDYITYGEKVSSTATPTDNTPAVDTPTVDTPATPTNPPANSGSSGKSDSPTTGDGTSALLAVLALGAISCVVLLKKKD